MIRNILSAVIVLSLVLVLGCSEISGLTKGLTDKSSPESPKILTEAELGSEWQMTQIEIKVVESSEISILLRLNDGDKVDGYFYLVKGTTIDFQIAGNSVIYQPEAEAAKKITSDRFSFIADPAQGTTYTLTFHSTTDNGESGEKVTVFLEIIYPIKSPLFFPAHGK